MGTWDIGFFDNDMACDWENGLVESKSLGYIEDAISPVLTDTDDTLDIDIANKALAASEALARLLGHDGEHTSYTDHIDNWVKEFTDPIPEELLQKALESLEIVQGSNSEIKQYWKIRGELDNWQSNIQNLKNRLVPNND
ncbi:MAG: DUF4259 domain-containing protein [Spirochaetaceae bacterium]